MKTPKQRAQKELAKLDAKIVKLNEYIENDVFNEIDDLQKDLLMAQIAAMATYSNILNARLNNWKEK